MQKLKIKNKGGEKASRNNPKCYSKQNQKEIQSGKKLSFSRKHLSLESVHSSLGISDNPINLLKIGTSGDISIYRWFKSDLRQVQRQRQCLKVSLTFVLIVYQKIYKTY